MTKLLTILFSFLLISSVIAGEDEKHQEPVIVETINGAHVYGEKWQGSDKIVDIKTALSKAEKYADKNMVFSGNISKVCQNSGCWMILEQKGEFAKVDFNDHAFFIPKDTQGVAEVYGKLSLKLMSDDSKEHLESEGAGSMPEKVYEIVATSVKILP